MRYYALGERVRNLVQSEVAVQRAHALIDVRAWPTQRQTRAELGTAACGLGHMDNGARRPLTQLVQPGDGHAPQAETGRPKVQPH